MPERNARLEPAARVSAALRRLKNIDAVKHDDGEDGATGNWDRSEAASLGARLQKTTNAFAALEAAVRKSRGDFVVRLAEYRDTLDRLELEGGEIRETDAALEIAMRIAHRIAGVGKTFGFEDLGDVARDAETAISDYRSRRGSPELRAESVAQINVLTGMIEHICAGHDTCLA